MSVGSESGSAPIGYCTELQPSNTLNTAGKTPEEETEGPHLDTDEYQNTQYLNTLGWSHLIQYQTNGELDELGQAIKYFSDAIAGAPDGSDMATWLNGLGIAYNERFQRLGELANLEEAIRHTSSALALTPEGHPDIAHRYSSLGVCYGHRYQRLGELADLDNTIEYFSRALELTPNAHPDISHRHASLGVSYTDRYRRLGGLADLEKAIECDSRALALTPDGHPDISRRHANLGISYRDKYLRLGELADIEKAIEYHTHALALTPNDHPDISRRNASLGVAYIDQYQRLGELSDLEKTIVYHTRALALTPEGHPDLSDRHVNLGLSHTLRYRRLGELADLEKAIECNTRALEFTPDGHPNLPHRYDSLGVSHTHRYQRLSERTDLEMAIECHTCALALTPEDHPDMSLRHASLGMSYRDQYLRSGKLEDLEKSTECHTRALALTSDGHPILSIRHFNYALSLLDQYHHSGDLACLTTSLHSFRKSSQQFIGAPRDRFHHAFQWANLASQQSLLNPIEAYQTAIDLLPQFIWLGATANQRYQDLSLAENLAVNACFAAIQSSNHSLALEWLEHARCVVWNQSLMLRSPLDQLHSSYPDLATQLQTVANQLQSFCFETRLVRATPFDSLTQEQTGQQRRRLAIEYNNLLAQTRQLPGFETFLKPVQANTLMNAVRDGPVVVINCHPDQCDALFILLGNTPVTHLALLNFTEEKAKQVRSDLDLSLIHQRLRERGIRLLADSGHEDRMESVLSILWTDLVKPVLDHLGYLNTVPKKHLPHITWCLTGPLSFLPLHAAGDYTQPQSRTFNYVISSYIPTLSALLASSPCLSNQNLSILAIGQATTLGHSPLPGTTQELAHLKAHTLNKADYLELTDSQATTSAVLDAMEQHDWVHLACHAHQNVNDPTRSGFHLHDGTLDLSAINRRSFKNKGLAFLSACQTATGDEKLPDEAIHLASGMLMAGYPSVIATMWSVVDEDAPLVADKVYGQLLKNGKVGNGEGGRALHYAVGELREKVGEKAFGRWVPYIHIGS